MASTRVIRAASSLSVLAAAGLLALSARAQGAVAAAPRPVAPSGKAASFCRSAADAKKTLQAKYGAAETGRIARGVDQVVRHWRPQDGDAASLKEFVEAEFVPQGPALDAAFGTFEVALERIGGYFNALQRDLKRGLDLDLAPMTPLDERLPLFDPTAHLSDDMFSSKLAFVALLNFPVTSLQEKLARGMGWSRRQWAETRLAGRFTSRVPAEVGQAITAAEADAEAYMNAYNIFMHHLLTAAGRRPFPAGMRLITHWNLRDELKARYADSDGLEAQRLIAVVMDRIVTEEIPRAVINNPLLDWNPVTNTVTVSKVKDADPPAGATAEPRNERNADRRYAAWLGIFRAVRRADPFQPDNPTFIDRSFNLQREIPEPEVKALLESVLASPLGERAGRLIARRLGRRLEPFDIWYAGFKPRSRYTEAELDAITKARYPTVQAYADDIPRLLRDLGFSREQARFVAERIVVEPSRGPGHALGAQMRDDKAHLRTRVGADGMDYKGYNIAVHEMGHNVEQVFSMTGIDRTLLQGVPNNAFTEALAFVFQARDLDLLGLQGPGAEAEQLRALEDFWATREIAGVGLVDIAAWRWLYAHPDATPARFRDAVVGIAREVWNEYYAPIFGVRDAPLLGIYSHIVEFPLYVCDYPLGHLIAFQVDAHFRETGKLGEEFERIARLGSITPDAWMRQAVGGPLSSGPLLEAVGAALDAMEQTPPPSASRRPAAPSGPVSAGARRRT